MNHLPPGDAAQKYVDRLGVLLSSGEYQKSWIFRPALPWKNLFTLKLADYGQHNEKPRNYTADTYQTICQHLRSSGAEVNTEVEASVLPNGLDSVFDRFIVAAMQFHRQNRDYNNCEINVNHPTYQPATR